MKDDGYDCSVSKRKGCNYCLRNKTIKTIAETSKTFTQISIEKGHIVIADVFGIKDIEINYCPICGKKLGDKK